MAFGQGRDSSRSTGQAAVKHLRSASLCRDAARKRTGAGPQAAAVAPRVIVEPPAAPAPGLFSGWKRNLAIMAGLMLFMKYGLPVLFEHGRAMHGQVGDETVQSRLQMREKAQEPAATPAVEGNVVNARSDDPEMEAARAKARAALDEFWSMLEAPRSGVDNLSLKVSLPTRSGSLEHIWVTQIERDGAVIRGRLSNDPRDIAGLKMGSPVTFNEAQIYDWMFNRNGKVVGNESARPLIARMPAAEAAKYRAMFETP